MAIWVINLEPGARFTVGFKCDPARVDELLAATRAELARLRTEPATAVISRRPRLITKR